MLDESHFFQIMEIIILRVYRVRYVIIYVRIMKVRYTRNFRQNIKRRQEFKMRWYSAGPIQSTRSVTGDFDPVNLFNTKFSCFTFPLSRPHRLVTYEWMRVDSVRGVPGFCLKEAHGPPRPGGPRPSHDFPQLFVQR